MAVDLDYTPYDADYGWFPGRNAMTLASEQALKAGKDRRLHEEMKLILAAIEKAVEEEKFSVLIETVSVEARNILSNKGFGLSFGNGGLMSSGHLISWLRSVPFQDTL